MLMIWRQANLSRGPSPINFRNIDSEGVRGRYVAQSHSAREKTCVKFRRVLKSKMLASAASGSNMAHQSLFQHVTIWGARGM
eukprot:793821-Karenia_brevis.AAC.1